jgi:hypothetical protein
MKDLAVKIAIMSGVIAGAVGVFIALGGLT